MAAIDFPASPVNNQTYTNPATGVVYIYSTTYSAWRIVTNNVGYTGSFGATGFTGSQGTAGSTITDFGINFATKTIAF
jgi:hypothetical protein